MTLAALKKQSDFSSLIDEYNKQTTPQSDTKSFDDERIWKPELDKSGNGYAVIRFLPAPEGEDIPWQRMFSHSFQGPGGWYIENSLTTINNFFLISKTYKHVCEFGSASTRRYQSTYCNIFL